MSKELIEMTFDELVDQATYDIQSALLESGSKGMRSMVEKYMQNSILWRQDLDEIEDKKSGVSSF